MGQTNCRCGARLDAFGNATCDDCAYEDAGRPGDCPTCGSVTEQPGVSCFQCQLSIRAEELFSLSDSDVVEFVAGLGFVRSGQRPKPFAV